jgi:hypothetical protein
MIHYSASKISKVLLALPPRGNKEKNFWGLALMCVKGKKLRCDFANIIIAVIDNNVTAIEHKKREKKKRLRRQ